MPDTATAPVVEVLSSKPAPSPAPAPSIPKGTAPGQARQAPLTPTPPTPPGQPPKPIVGIRDALKKAADRRGPDDQTGQPKIEEPAKPTVNEPETPKTAAPEVEQSKDTPETPKAPETPVKPKSDSPWKIVDTYKKEVKSLKTELASLKASMADPEAVDKAVKRAEAAESKAKELDAHMRYLDYEKSEEFKTKHQQPYEKAWKAATRLITQLTVATPEGERRPATSADLLRLANMPLQEAHTAAVEMFGDLAGTVMNHRDKIVELYEAQQEDLAEAKKASQERAERLKADETVFHKETLDLVQRLVTEEQEKYDYLKPKDDDDEHNTKLEKAKEFVIETMGASIKDPKLSKDQRADLIRRMVAVRNRAIGFSTIKLENTRLLKQLAEKDKIIAEFKASEPGPGNGGKSSSGNASSDPFVRVNSMFRAAADRTG